MTNPKKPYGCLVAFQRLFSGLLAVLATIFLVSLLIFLTYEVRLKGMSLLIFTASSFFVLRYLWKKVKRRLNSNAAVFKGIFADLGRTVMVFALFSIILTILIKNAGYRFDTDKPNDEGDSTEVITTTENGKEIKYIVNKQSWKDFQGNWHRMDFKVAENSVKKSKKNRLDFRYTRNFKWGTFYKHMADHDQPLLNNLYDAFSKLQKEKKMNRRQFAEFIITSIQDIQYNYIKSTPCNGSEDFPCVGNVRLGIFAPAEFSASLQGDCDTRTVLLFVLLTKFNYDVAILNSNQYKHSVLGIHLPATGSYKTFNRKRYYFVETTAKGCKIGYLPRNVGNTRYWDFVLINKKASL
jgi:membrane protein implicated in regulation of membrane protease activity